MLKLIVILLFFFIFFFICFFLLFIRSFCKFLVGYFEIIVIKYETLTIFLFNMIIDFYIYLHLINFVFFADEFPNSGEDSEEDEVIDYSDNSIMNENSMNLNIQGTTNTDIKYTKDNSVLVMSETMNDKHALIPDSNIHNQPHPLVPIISVTPHSPGVVSKYYPVLGKQISEFFLFLHKYKFITKLLTLKINNFQKT